MWNNRQSESPTLPCLDFPSVSQNAPSLGRFSPINVALRIVCEAFVPMNDLNEMDIGRGVVIDTDHEKFGI